MSPINIDFSYLILSIMVFSLSESTTLREDLGEWNTGPLVLMIGRLSGGDVRKGQKHQTCPLGMDSDRS